MRRANTFPAKTHVFPEARFVWMGRLVETAEASFAARQKGEWPGLLGLRGVRPLLFLIRMRAGRPRSQGSGG